MKIDKSLWKPVKLLDVVTKKEENDKDNAKSRFQKFLKVDHLDAENLHIKRIGNQNDEELPPTFYKIFREGQILFPTRNPHLRRTALASFDGICGEKTLTLEPNAEVINPKFIPFLFHSESFYAHTTGAIVGSTNPHVRWRDVANYEFLLPPKDQQAKLAELLWAADEVVEREKIVVDKLKQFISTKVEDLIHGINCNKKSINKILVELINNRKVKSLNECGKILKGKGIQKTDLIKIGIPCVRYGELYTKHSIVIREYFSFISETVARESQKLKKHDVLFAGSGETITEIGKSAAFIDDTEVYGGSDTLIFRPNKMDGIYLGYLMNSKLVRYQLNKLGTGATVMHIYPDDLKKIIIPDDNLETQEKIGKELEIIQKNIISMNSKIHTSIALQKSIINQVF